MRETRPRRYLFRAGLVLLPMLGCEAVLGVDFDSARQRIECDSVRPPAPPDVGDVGGEVEIVAVVSSGEYGDGVDAEGQPRYLGIGYDIDENCSNRGDEPLCVPPSWTEGEHRDGPHGEDNAIGRVLSTQEENFGIAVITSPDLNESLANGSQAPPVVLRIRGFSGFSEDDRIEVDWFVPLAPKRLPVGGFTPKLDGSDAWPLAANFVVGASSTSDAGTEAGIEGDSGALGSESESAFRDDNAYVTGHKLVAYFDEARISFSNAYFHIVDVVVTADLVRSTVDQPWSVRNGLIVGKISAGRLLSLIPRITSEVVGQPLCTDNPNYATVKRFMCAQMDLKLAAASNSPRECNGASFAVAFETVPAKLGVSSTLSDGEPLCPEATDPERDDCRKPVAELDGG